ARVPDDPGSRARGVPALRLDPPQRLHQFAPGADRAPVRKGRPGAAVRRAADGGRGVHRVGGHRAHGGDQPRAAARGRGPRGAAAYHDARRAVSLRPHGRSRALPADERQLRAARAARAGAARQAEEEGAAGGAGARGDGGVRPAARRRGRGVSGEIEDFVAFLAQARNDSPHPAKAARTPKPERHLPVHLDRAEVDLLFAEAERRATAGGFTEVRDLAMLELFYSTGMRLAELAGLNDQDLDLISDQVKVRGKG